TGELRVFPGAASGYTFTIGSDASYTVVGTLELSGRDLYLLSGTMTSLQSGEAKDFFTNRTGRFVVERVAPGDYILRVNGFEEVAQITVDESENTYVDFGKLELR
ncbi:MAG: carboxypeptidase-like regulatory domain-containing protein, partial [Pararhodobacter sp.]